MTNDRPTIRLRRETPRDTDGADVERIPVGPESADSPRAFHRPVAAPHQVVAVLPVDTRIEPEMRADEAVRVIARRQLQAMLANHCGTALGLDPEYLHDFRVAVRRSRSLLTQVKGVLPEGAVHHFSRELAWLAQETGPSRDLDVLFEAFGSYESVVWDRLRGGAGVLRSELLDRKSTMHRALAQTLGSDRFEQLIRDWRGFLYSPLPVRSAEPHALQPIRSVASVRIQHKSKRIFGQRSSIDASTPPERLHKLRIQFKKLRYLIEFFADVFSPDGVKQAIDELKIVQDDLGELNDLRVHRSMLLELSADLTASGDARREAILAAGEISQHLGREFDARRRTFAEDFRGFTRPKNRRRYRELVED
jgi:CHAD domain-containing protein